MNGNIYDRNFFLENIPGSNMLGLSKVLPVAYTLVLLLNTGHENAFRGQSTQEVPSPNWEVKNHVHHSSRKTPGKQSEVLILMEN